MADPINPAGGPPSGGGGDKPPLDPGTASVLDKMKSTLYDVNLRLEGTEKSVREVREQVEKTTDAFKQNLKMSEDMEETIKKQVEWGKKHRDLDIKSLQDARKARKELQDYTDLLEEGLKYAQTNSKEAKTMTKNLTEAKRLQKELANATKLSSDQFERMRDLAGEASHNVENLDKAMRNLSRTGALIKGVTGVLGATGIGKGLSRSIEQRMEQMQEIREKVAEARTLRKTATTRHMLGKRGKALEEMKNVKGGLSVDPETGQVMGMFDDKGALTKGGRDVLARKMGFTRGTKQYGSFVGGEAAMAAGKDAGANYAATMASGGGAIEAVGVAFETGMEGLTMGLEAVALPLSLLVAGIELLIDAFDGYVKQNQEMEKNIGKAGLFTQPGVGAGTAFMNARAALTPPIGLAAGAGLGMSFDRNMALAGAIANAGYGGINQELAAPNMANMRPGARGEFMGGGMGEMQRVVMGVSRVSGLTDQEGIDNLIKLMGEYRETIASSEMFMAQLNKDTQAAGISTTKYLKIIDEVTSHFDKMNKSLEQVTGVMREMSRYGDISSETLKDMMEFLTSAQQKTDLGTVATAAFTQTNLQGTKSLQTERRVERSTLDQYVKNLNQEAPSDFGQGLDISGAINRGDYGTAQDMANAMRRRIEQVKSPIVRQNMQDALDKVQDQIRKVAGVMDNSPLGRAASESLLGPDAVQTMTSLFQNLRTSARTEGGFREVLLEGGGSPEQKLLVQQLARMLGVSGPAGVAKIVQREATTRLQTATQETDPEKRRALLKELFKEAIRKKGLPMSLKASGLDSALRNNADDTFDAIVASGTDTNDGLKKVADLVNDNLDSVAASQETQDTLVAKAGEQNKISKDDLAHNLDQARAIATRTQKVEDFLSNILKPLLNRLLFAVEKIATAVTNVLGGDFASSAAQQASDMAKVPGAIQKLNDMLDQKMEDKKALDEKAAKGKLSPDEQKQYDSLKAQIAEGTDTLAKLNTLQEQGNFQNQGQEDSFNMALDKLNSNQVAQMKDASDTSKSLRDKLIGTPSIVPGSPADRAIQATKVAYSYYYNIFSSDVTQTHTVPSGGNVSPGESPSPPTPPVAKKGP